MLAQLEVVIKTRPLTVHSTPVHTRTTLTSNDKMPVIGLLLLTEATQGIEIKMSSGAALAMATVINIMALVSSTRMEISNMT